jgi:predicted TIM-barrel fold metal-dependent hydrolase
MDVTETKRAADAWHQLGGQGALGERKERTVKLLPDPDPRPRHWPIISVDDHIVEPPHMFEGRLPAKLQDRAPKIVEDPSGNQVWEFEGRRVSTIGLSAVVGRADDDWTTDPSRFDEMRPGCWDIKERVRDMDLAGIYASLCFGSFLPGFAGRVFNKLADQEYGLALVRAWNEWHLEEWCGTYPDRMISCQLPWLNDPVVAAAEVRANAAKGFKSVSFSENPAAHGLPSLHSGYWDPFLQACEETQTVVCLHGASSGWTAVQAKDAPLGEFTTMFTINAMVATIDWIWSKVPVRFPELKIVMSESGVSWVPAIIERLDYVMEHSMRGDNESWPVKDVTPSDVLRRNFWFSSLDDPSGITLRHQLGVENILVESDYPHSDSTWPDTQDVIKRSFAGVPDDEAALMAYGNAAKLFRHPVRDVSGFVNSPVL